MCANARCIFPLPPSFDDAHAAPLLCAGLIGYRAFRLAGQAQRIGFYGFGAAAHVLIQIATHLARQVYVFTRPDDSEAQQFARALGAVWTGASTQLPPEPLDAALIFAPAGALVPAALAAVRKGGCVVCAGIHMSDIPSFPYALLWHERVLRSVANLTRKDGADFLSVAAEIPLQIEIERFPLEAANETLEHVRAGKIRGAAVLLPRVLRPAAQPHPPLTRYGETRVQPPRIRETFETQLGGVGITGAFAPFGSPTPAHIIPG
jgi:propanol-preferring alcohol dehydrogenase